MKRVTLAVLLAVVLAGLVTCQPNQAANDKQHVAQNKDQAAATANTPEHSDNAKERNGNGDPEPTKWYAALKRSDWWLVVAAFATLGVVCWQAIATANATKAMRKSVELEEIALQQWVDLVNWRSNFVLDSENVAAIKVRVDVVNPTNFPFTIKNASITFDNGLTYYFREDFFLTPKNPYTVAVTIRITESQYGQYLENGLRITVKGNIPLAGSLRKLQPQPFLGTLVCRRDETRFESQTPVRQEGKTGEEKQSGEDPN